MGRKNIPNIIMLSISRKLPAQKERQNLYRLFGTLFSDKLAAAMAQLFGRLMDAGRKEEWQRVINDEEYRNRMIRKMNL